MKQNEIEHKPSPAYQPQPNGMAESAVKIVTKALKRMTERHFQNERKWDTFLPAILRGYNMSKQGSTNVSPFFLLHGYHPTVPLGQADEIPRIARIVQVASSSLAEPQVVPSLTEFVEDRILQRDATFEMVTIILQ